MTMMEISEIEIKQKSFLNALEVWRQDRTNVAFYGLYSTYSLFINDVTASRQFDNILQDDYADKALKIIFDHLPTWWDACVEQKRYSHMCTGSGCTRLLLNPEYMEYVKSVPGSEQPVAWLLCYESTGYTEYPMEDDKDKLVKLLQAWTGVTLDEDFEPTINNVIDVLYGPSCWPLYGIPLSADVEDVELNAIVSQIVSLNIPFAFNSPSQKYEACPLPVNLDM